MNWLPCAHHKLEQVYTVLILFRQEAKIRLIAASEIASALS